MWPDTFFAPITLLYNHQTKHVWETTTRLFKEVFSESSSQREINVIFFVEGTMDEKTECLIKHQIPKIKILSWDLCFSKKRNWQFSLLVDYDLERIQRARNHNIYAYTLPQTRIPSALTRAVWCDSMICYVFFSPRMLLQNVNEEDNDMDKQ